MNIQVVPSQNIKSFMADIAEAYQVAYEYRFGQIDYRCIDEKFISRVCYKRHCLYFEVVDDGKRLGGLILSLIRNGKCARMFFMFTKPELQNRGVATFLWNELRELMPGVKTFTAVAPYFAVPAIHFLVNKCHFKIIEFINSVNSPKDYAKDEINDPWSDGYFYFIKRVSKVIPVGKSKPASSHPGGMPKA